MWKRNIISRAYQTHLRYYQFEDYKEYDKHNISRKRRESNEHDKRNINTEKTNQNENKMQINTKNIYLRTKKKLQDMSLR